MVFSSIPAYLDPTQWQQQQQPNHQSAASSSIAGHSSLHLLPHHPSPPRPPPQTSHGGGGGGSAGSIRPGSMVDRARMANLPLPESALKCPRCESTNTKFCYFNNYSLSQPRHFCKTCRRYWTRGGALRSVPVGGGYRRNNKRSKSSSKSPVNSGRHATDPDASSHESTQIPSSKFISPFHQLTDQQLSDGDHHQLSLNYSAAISAPNIGAGDLKYPIGNANFSSNLDQIQWRLQLQLQQTVQQPPLLATSGSLFGSSGEASSSYNIGQIQQKMEASKMEENGQEINLMGRQVLGVSASDHHHYWTGFTPSFSHT